jgi:hypothetical protein
MRAKQARNVLSVTERLADGVATRSELVEARRWIDDLDPQIMRKDRAAFVWATAPEGTVHRLAVGAAGYAAEYHDRPKKEAAVQCRLIREIFGNPFRASPAIDVTWLTPLVVELGGTIYERRSFDRMPALADALEEAGCHNADILDHCRSQTQHVRGCWVVDTLLGKE